MKSYNVKLRWEIPINYKNIKRSRFFSIESNESWFELIRVGAKEQQQVVGLNLKVNWSP